MTKEQEVLVKKAEDSLFAAKLLEANDLIDIAG